MSRPLRLDRKARVALTGLILVILMISVLSLRSCVVALSPVHPVAALDSSQDDIVLIGRQTMVVPGGSVGSRIVSWLSAGDHRSHAFEVGDASFRPGSDEPSEAGLAQLDRFAQMMRADGDVTARVTVVASGEYRTSGGLAQKRAARIRTELFTRGVPRSRISAQAQDTLSTASKGKQPTVLIVLSK